MYTYRIICTHSMYTCSNCIFMCNSMSNFTVFKIDQDRYNNDLAATG